MRITDIIAKKRDGNALSDDEIAFFVRAYTSGDAPDYQASALLMAIYLRGMNQAETAALTAAMAGSGRQLDLHAAGLPPDKPTLDKHSTGGVGDKTSLVVVPLLAALGTYVCKMSGRGLGHTGGTLDKLESIPGFRVGLSPEEMVRQVADVGACLAGQTADLAPADKKLYALRDATGTVGSLPLIVSSILSKKLAGGAASFLFDVKVGSGALMETDAEALALAQELVDGAGRNGRRAVAVISDMSQPLGDTTGNALEVAEAIRTLTPEAAPVNSRFRELCVFLAAQGLLLAGTASSDDDARARVEEVLQNGAALAAFRRIVEAQGGDVSVADDPEKLPQAPVREAIAAPQAGYVAAINARVVGEAVVAMGGGRARKEDTIDPSVGAVIAAPVGKRVASGDTLVYLYARTAADAETARASILAAYRFSDTPVDAPPLIRHLLSASS